MYVMVGDLSPSRAGAGRMAAALRLAELGVSVVPGARITLEGSCSCGSSACRSPGKHPIDPAWLLHATTNPADIVRWWTQHPDANVVAPLLGPFHVVDAPARIGRLVVDWLGGHAGFTGPIAVTPDHRYHFWAAPGVAVELGVVLDRRGHSQSGADMRIHREGSYVVVPPSTHGPFADYRWKLPPRAHIRELPGSAMLVRLLLEACRELYEFLPQAAG